MGLHKIFISKLRGRIQVSQAAILLLQLIAEAATCCIHLLRVCGQFMVLLTSLQACPHSMLLQSFDEKLNFMVCRRVWSTPESHH